jgi:cytochrome b
VRREAPDAHPAVRRDGEGKVVVWDAATRLFHWLLVALVIACYVTYRLSWVAWHERLGDAVLALVIFRILWGFFGSENTRFTAFLGAPRAALRYLGGIARRRHEIYAGHNPAGGWMIVLLLLVLLGETLSGVFVANDVADVGPMTAMASARFMNMMTSLHAIFWDALLAAVALHVLAILFYAVVLRQDLVMPMITGRKNLPHAVAPPRLAGLWRALWLLGCGALAAAAIANLA